MDGIPALIISIALAYGYAVIARRALQIRGRTGLFVSIIAGVVVLFIPLLIPADRIGLRALGAFLCAELMFKMVDYARQYNRTNEGTGPLAGYLRFLIPFPVLLVVFDLRRRRPWAQNILRKRVSG